MYVCMHCQEIKKLITSPPCLMFYDHNQLTRLKLGASSEDFGALLEHNHGTADCTPENLPHMKGTMLKSKNKPSQSYLEIVL